MKRSLVIVSTCLLAACGKFDDGMKGPEPVPDTHTKAEWRSYGQMPGFEVLVDVNSIGHRADYADANYTFVWMLQRFQEEQVDGTSKGKYRLKYMRQAIDCPSGRMAGISVDLRDIDGNEVARYDVPGFQWEFGQPAKDSYGADFVRQVCKIMADKDAAAQKEKN